MGTERQHFWEGKWGRTYDLELKRRKFLPFLERLNLGKIVVDVGSGFESVLDQLPGRRKIISLDFAGDRKNSESRHHVRLDVEHIDDASLKVRRGVLEFLKDEPAGHKRRPLADDIVFSDILEHVDYQHVLRSFVPFLRPGGRFIICNQPMRGFDGKPSSEKGVMSNIELYAFLESLGFTIEEKEYVISKEDYPDLDLEPSPEDLKFVMLAARKK